MLALLAGPGLAKFHLIYLIVGGLGVLSFLLALLLPIGRASPEDSSPSPFSQREIPTNPPSQREEGGISASTGPKASRWRQLQ